MTESQQLTGYEGIGATAGARVDREYLTYVAGLRTVRQILQIIYPRGVRPEQIGDMLAIVRMVDQMISIAKSSPSEKFHSRQNPLMEIASYGILKSDPSVSPPI